jgi:uncharacterized protein YecT (DUF1311 family)
MKKIMVLIVICLISNFGFSQTQFEMNQSANNDFLKADKELNSVYQEIIKEYKSDINFIKNLKASQKIWIQFRDAEMKVKFPEREDGYYGSVFPMCWSSYMEELTRERTKKLKIWLTGIEEGDVCSGSVKIKQTK